MEELTAFPNPQLDQKGVDPEAVAQSVDGWLKGF